MLTSRWPLAVAVIQMLDYNLQIHAPGRDLWICDNGFVILVHGFVNDEHAVVNHENVLLNVSTDF